jgi:menaquinone-dependent protoporphyrinogen oxidase
MEARIGAPCGTRTAGSRSSAATDLEEMSGMRILVTAASRHGSTAEIATELGKILRSDVPHAQVDVAPMSRMGSVDGYDAVVLGSAVYFGRWLDEARSQVGKHLETLRGLPVWLFSSGPVGDPSVPDTESSDAIELAAAIGARDHVVFAGSLSREFLGVREKMAVRLVHTAEGDYRDWPAVRAWAGSIAADLTLTPSGT